MLSITSTAVAYWTTGGGGNGSGTSGTSLAITLGPGTPTSQLYPDGRGDVAVAVSNPNSFRVHIGSLSLDASRGTAGFRVDAGHAACSTAPLSFTSQTNGGAGWTVPPKVGSTNGSLSLDLANAVAMTSSAANGCQGATFVVYLNEGP
jgi:hypothetical protein